MSESFCGFLGMNLAHISMFYQRIKHEYVGQKNFYALEYDGDEVIDAVSLAS